MTGENPSFDAQPEDGYRLKELVVNGKAIENINEALPTPADKDKVTVVAAFKAIPTHTITFLDRDGKQTGEPVEVQENAMVAAPQAPEIPGYTFKRWVNQEDSKPFDCATTPVTENITLKAEYEKKSDGRRQGQDARDTAQRRERLGNAANYGKP